MKRKHLLDNERILEQIKDTRVDWYWRGWKDERYGDSRHVPEEWEDDYQRGVNAWISNLRANELE